MENNETLSFYVGNEYINYVRGLMNKTGISEDRLLMLDLKSPKKAKKYSKFLGLVGIDRFYIGDTVFGLLKLVLTCSGLGLIWWIIDIFRIEKVTYNKNLGLIRSVLEENYTPVHDTDILISISKDQKVHAAVKEFWDAHKESMRNMEI